MKTNIVVDFSPPPEKIFEFWAKMLLANQIAAFFKM